MSKRRVFSREFKIEAVKLVTQQGYGVSQAAESLGISANARPGCLKACPAEDAGSILSASCSRCFLE